MRCWQSLSNRSLQIRHAIRLGAISYTPHRGFVVPASGGGDHVGFRRHQIVFLSKGSEETARRLGLDITAQRGTACPERHRMRSVSQ